MRQSMCDSLCTVLVVFVVVMCLSLWPVCTARTKWSSQADLSVANDHSPQVSVAALPEATLWSTPNHHHHDHQWTNGITFSDPDNSESHILPKIENYEPMIIHTTKLSRSILPDPSLLMSSAVPPLLLTILTFPLTLSLLFHIVRQLVLIQNTFNQNIASMTGPSSKSSLYEVNNTVTNSLKKSIDKFQTERARTKRHALK